MDVERHPPRPLLDRSAAGGVDAVGARRNVEGLRDGLTCLIGLPDLLGSTHHYGTEFTAGLGFLGIAVALLGRNSGLGIVAGALLFSFLDRASSGIGLNTDVPKEVTTIMQGVIILTIVIAYEVVRRMTARRQLREQHERA